MSLPSLSLATGYVYDLWVRKISVQIPALLLAVCVVFDEFLKLPEAVFLSGTEPAAAALLPGGGDGGRSSPSSTAQGLAISVISPTEWRLPLPPPKCLMQPALGPSTAVVRAPLGCSSDD